MQQRWYILHPHLNIYPTSCKNKIVCLAIKCIYISSPSPLPLFQVGFVRLLIICMCAVLGEHHTICWGNNFSPLSSFCLFSCSAQSIYTYLNGHLDMIKKSLPVGFLTVDLHVWPDFHGNRSPLADLSLKGMVRRNRLPLQRFRAEQWSARKSLTSAFLS